MNNIARAYAIDLQGYAAHYVQRQMIAREWAHKSAWAFLDNDPEEHAKAIRAQELARDYFNKSANVRGLWD